MLEWLNEAPAFRPVIVFRLGERTPGTVWRHFRLNAYGTLAVFRNGREIARDTPQSAAGIARLFQIATVQK